MIREVKRTVTSGYLMLVVLTVAQLLSGYIVYKQIVAQSVAGTIAAILVSTIVLIRWAGLFLVPPNEAKVLQLFGKSLFFIRWK